MDRYLGAFTKWMPGNHCIQALHKGRLFPILINLTTLKQFFSCSLAEESSRSLPEKKRLGVRDPQNFNEHVLLKAGRELCEAFYLCCAQGHWEPLLNFRRC